MKNHSVRNRLETTFLNLIKIDEVYPEEKKIIEFVINFLKKLSIPTKQDSFGNVIAYIKGEGEPILLNTHVDSPENVPNLDFETDEDSIRATGKSILGADPKSGLAVLLEFARYIKKNDITTCPIELVFTRGEEAGLLGAINLDFSLLTSKIGLVLDEDGPCTNIVTKAPGYYRLDATFQGKTVHPRDWKEGKNVLKPLSKILTVVKQGEIVEGITCNIGMVTAGTARNSVAGIGELKAEFRGFDTKKLLKEAVKVEIMLKAFCKKEGVEITIDSKLEFNSYELKNHDDLFQRLNATYKKMRLTPNFYTTYGGSDAAIFNEHGVTTVPIGSGYYLPHQYYEYVHLTDMETLLRFLIQFSGLTNNKTNKMRKARLLDMARHERL